MGPEWTEPKTIQRWPGRLGHELHNKVTTCVSYDSTTGSQHDWGFLCEYEEDIYDQKSHFKLNLDPGYKDPTTDPPSTRDAQQWYKDYMACLYAYIIQFFRDTTPHFNNKSVQ